MNSGQYGTVSITFEVALNVELLLFLTSLFKVTNSPRAIVYSHGFCTVQF